MVEGIIHGPAYIGPGSIIGKDTIIEHYVDLESNVIINGGAISRSLILSDVKLELGKARIVDSIIGPKSAIKLERSKHTVIIGEKI